MRFRSVLKTHSDKHTADRATAHNNAKHFAARGNEPLFAAATAA